MKYIYMIGYKDDFMSGMFVPIYNTLDKTEAYIIAPKVKEAFSDAEDYGDWFIVEYPIDTTLTYRYGWMDYFIERI